MLDWRDCVWLPDWTKEDVGRVPEVWFWNREDDSEIGPGVLDGGPGVVRFHESIGFEEVPSRVPVAGLLEFVDGPVLEASFVVSTEDEKAARVWFRDPDVVFASVVVISG